MARRIVCWVREGNNLNKGQSFGMIRFGSGTEILVPDSIDINVKSGDRVKAGITVIGTIKE